MIVSLWSVHVYVLLSLFHGLDRVGLGWMGFAFACLGITILLHRVYFYIFPLQHGVP